MSSSKPESISREQIIIVFLLRTCLHLEKHLLEKVFQNSSDEVILMLDTVGSLFMFQPESCQDHLVKREVSSAEWN